MCENQQSSGPVQCLCLPSVAALAPAKHRLSFPISHFLIFDLGMTVIINYAGAIHFGAIKHVFPGKNP